MRGRELFSFLPPRGGLFAHAALAALVLAAAGAGCGHRAGGDTGTGAPRVTRGRVAPTLLLTGELVAAESVRLSAPNVNIWPLQVEWLAEEGAPVAPGEPVVELDNSQLTGNLEDLRSRVVEAANRLEQARAEAEAERGEAAFALAEKRAALERARLAAALPRELTAEQLWERRRLELEKARLEAREAERALAATERAARSRVEVGRLALEKARLGLERAESGLAALTLAAPRAGIVLLAENRREGRPFRVGDTVYPGTAVASLPDLATLRVEARLFDVDDGRIQPGREVVATVDAFPDEPLAGEVVAASSFAREESAESARRAFTLEIAVAGIDPERMRPGMSVKVEVSVAGVAGEGTPQLAGLLVPRVAIAFGPPASDAARVRLADGGWVEVELGACDAQACVLAGDASGRLGEGTAVAEAGRG